MSNQKTYDDFKIEHIRTYLRDVYLINNTITDISRKTNLSRSALHHFIYHSKDLQTSSFEALMRHLEAKLIL